MDLCIAGMGGIGTHLVRILKRLSPEISLTGIDGDRIEARNLVRQSFDEEFVGEFKVTALEKDLTFAFGEFLTENEEQWDALLALSRVPAVIFGAVDNMRGRRTILKFAQYVGNLTHRIPFVVLCGNERDDAEAIIWKPGLTPLHPFILTPEMETKQDDRDPTTSCQVVVASAPQTALANETAAIIGVHLWRTWERAERIKTEFSTDEYSRYIARLPQRIVWQKGLFLHYPEAKKGGLHVPTEE